MELRKYLATRRGNKDKPPELVFLSVSANDIQQGGEVQKKGKEPTYEFPPLLNVTDRHEFEGGSVKKGLTTRFGGSSVASSNFEMRRHSSVREGKPIEESIASRYRHVSIFSWYPPKKLPEETPLKQEGTLVGTTKFGKQPPKIFGYARDAW